MTPPPDHSSPHPDDAHHDPLLGALDLSGELPPTIGELIGQARDLDADTLERIARYQREHSVKFGEAAIALGLAREEDVLHALSRQFGYAYAHAEDEVRGLSPELVMLQQPFGHQAEAFRATRSQILLRSGEGEKTARKRPLAIVSPGTGDGKTFFCANLSVALAQLGGRVLVIDADLRGARMHQIFNLDNRVGLSNVLAGRQAAGAVKAVRGVPNLYVLPVGIQPPNPLELVAGQGFGRLLREVSTRFDHVVVDTPATMFGSDGVVIAARCGSALIVTRRDVGKVAAARELVSALQTGRVLVAGVVMNEF